MAKRGGAQGQQPPAGGDEPDDSAVIQGSPHEPQGAAPAATSEEVVDVEVGGRKYSVPKAIAEHYTAQQNDFNSRFDRIEQGLQALRQPAPTTKPRQQPSSQTAPDPDDEFGDIDFDTLILTDPKKAFKLVKERTKKEVAEQMRGEYTAEQSRQQFWNDFYENNKDLAKHKKLVDMVLNANFNEIGVLKAPDAAKKIAEYTRQEIVAIRGGTEPQNNRRNDRTRSEVGSNSVQRPAGGGAADADDDGVVSLSSVLKKRAETRRAKKSA